jgi:hypothetical protein
MASAAGAQDFQRELDEIQCPKPFDVGFRPDAVNHHLADDLEGRLREWYQFSWYGKRTLALCGCLTILKIQLWRLPYFLLFLAWLQENARFISCRHCLIVLRRILTGDRPVGIKQACFPKLLLPPRSGQSERWPTTRLHCRSGADRDDVRGTSEHS